MPDEFERVYTVNDWHDGPRAGFADCRGRPARYFSRWDDDSDESGPRYELEFVTAEVLALACEDWEIWRRWQQAHRAGVVTGNPWPALPPERGRSEELRRVLDPILSQPPLDPIFASAEFRRAPLGDPTHPEHFDLEVCWRDVAVRP
ncbi:MAG: hypothetical protein IPK85_04650 [Gemmatimonadetes bacterium]|nr:hypothetical protein [Gemmatimonadota bacterium]